MARAEKPELFSTNDPSLLRPGENWKPVSVKVTPDGGYDGNGHYKVPEDCLTLRITGFDRRNGREFWVGIGYIKTSIYSI